MTWAVAAPAIGSIGTGIAQGISGENEAKINQQVPQENYELNRDTTAARESAYGAAKATGSANQAAGEGALGSFTGGTGLYGTENPMLGQESKDIAAKNAQELQQGAGQMSANLAGSGVRGGQAATLLNRGTGGMAINAQEDVNQMKYQDAAQRQAAAMAYQAAKAGAGQSAATGSIGF